MFWAQVPLNAAPLLRRDAGKGPTPQALAGSLRRTRRWAMIGMIGATGDTFAQEPDFEACRSRPGRGRFFKFAPGGKVCRSHRLVTRSTRCEIIHCTNWARSPLRASGPTLRHACDGLQKAASWNWPPSVPKRVLFSWASLRWAKRHKLSVKSCQQWSVHAHLCRQTGRNTLRVRRDMLTIREPLSPHRGHAVQRNTQHARKRSDRTLRGSSGA